MKGFSPLDLGVERLRFPYSGSIGGIRADHRSVSPRGKRASRARGRLGNLGGDDGSEGGAFRARSSSRFFSDHLIDWLYSNASARALIGPVRRSRDGESSAVGVAHRIYAAITIEDSEMLDVETVSAGNSPLFMWSSGSHLDQAIRIGQSWGFGWAMVAFVWNKMKINPEFYTMPRCESCLAFKRGEIPNPRGARNIKQYVEAERGRHSAKPDEVRRRISDMFPARKNRAVRAFFGGMPDGVGLGIRGHIGASLE